MRIVRVIVLAFGILALAAPSTGVFSQDEPEVKPPPANDEGAPREDEKVEDVNVEDEVFIPSEEIPADEEVTFPVNI